jgi:hypothetical protein
MDTVPVAMVETRDAAEEVAERLREHGIKCAVVDPPADATSGVFSGGTAGWDSAYRAAFGVVVATEDEARARDCLRSAAP